MARAGASRGWRAGLEWAVPVLATVTACAWLASLVSSGTGLWRDEVCSVNTQIAPTLSGMWALAEFDSFPVLWMLLLRGWMSVAGSSDEALRAFGLLGAFFMIGSVWTAGRSLGVRAPALTLALIAVNPELLRWAASVRAWGFGAGLAVLALPVMFKVVESPTRRRVALATAVSILSVQCLYQNAILLGATIAACCVVALRRSAPKHAAVVIGIGAIAAASLLPYIAVIRRRGEWNALGSAVIDAGDLAQKAWEVAAAPGLLTGVLWAALATTAVLAGLLHAIRRRTPEPARTDVAVFGGVVVAVAVAGMVALYLQLSYPTQAWYYLGLFVLAGVSAEAGIASTIDTRISSPALALAAVLVIGTAATAGASGWAASREPYTNLASVSEHLEQAAVAGDLIIANPWFLGIPLARYYHGAASVETIPGIPDRSIARYDLLKAQMIRPNAVAPILERIAHTLQSGHRVWLVGNYELPPPGTGQADLQLPPPPLPERGWSAAPYEALWSFQMGLFLNSHAKAVRQVSVVAGGRHESAGLLEFSGWQGPSPRGR